MHFTLKSGSMDIESREVLKIGRNKQGVCGYYKGLLKNCRDELHRL